MREALVLLTTPFQAALAKKVLAAERISLFDVLYVTHNDSEEDRRYFNRLSTLASRSEYIVVRQGFSDFLSSLQTILTIRKRFSLPTYDAVLLASLDSYVFAWLTAKNTSQLISFDDGIGNFLKNGVFSREREDIRPRLYRMLLDIPSMGQLIDSVSRHYSLYPQQENIVDKFKVRGLSISMHVPVETNAAIKTFFVGQPFEEYMSTGQMASLRDFAHSMLIDYYVPHPREKSSMEVGAARLSKNGMLAEEAIIKAANGSRIRVIGGISTTLFNLAPYSNSQLMLVPAALTGYESVLSLARRIGIEVIFLD